MLVYQRVLYTLSQFPIGSWWKTWSRWDLQEKLRKEKSVVKNSWPSDSLSFQDMLQVTWLVISSIFSCSNIVLGWSPMTKKSWGLKANQPHGCRCPWCGLLDATPFLVALLCWAEDMHSNHVDKYIYILQNAYPNANFKTIMDMALYTIKTMSYSADMWVFGPNILQLAWHVDPLKNETN